MVGSYLSGHVPTRRLDQGTNYTAPTLLSLLWEWVNAKHTGGVPNCIWLARPLLLDCGLASFERGLSCTEQSSASLAGALLSRGGLCLLHGNLTTTILPAAPSLSLC